MYTYNFLIRFSAKKYAQKHLLSTKKLFWYPVFNKLQVLELLLFYQPDVKYHSKIHKKQK